MFRVKEWTFLTLVFLSLISCGLINPMSGGDMAKVVEQLKNDPATLCVTLSGRAGGMMVVIPVPGGSYGSSEAILCRSGAPDAKITIEGGKMTIEHGKNATEAEKAKAIKPNPKPELLKGK